MSSLGGINIFADGTLGDVSINCNTGVQTQQWKITQTSSGAYRVIPRSSEAITSMMTMSVATPSNSNNTNGTKITQNGYSSSYGEWEFAQIMWESDVECEEQEMSLWCWAATSRMFAKNYYSNVSLTQYDIVREVKGNIVNEIADRSQAILAINHYIDGSDDDNDLDLVYENYEIYSKENLIRFLNDGHVLYLAIMYYDYDPIGKVYHEGTNSSGHAVLLYGYVKIGSEYRFLIKDPDGGFMYMTSYECLCNSDNYQEDDLVKMEQGAWLWYSAITVNTSYSSDRIDINTTIHWQ